MLDRATYQREYQQNRLAADPEAWRERRRGYRKRRFDDNPVVEKERKRKHGATYRAKLKAKLGDKTSDFNFANSLWGKYRMRPEQYAEMLANQNGVCAFCSGVNKGKRLCVDHDHTKPKGEGNRWLLCTQCNTGIGQFKDNSALLRIAAGKLDEYYGSLSNSGGLRG